MLFKEELQEIIRLISNTMDTFTTALFLVKGEKLISLAHHSLSPRIRLPMALALEDGGILTLALDKEYFFQEGLTEKGFELPYYSESEEIKAFMTVRLAGGRGLLMVDSKRSYTLTEKHQKILGHFARLVELILDRARDLRGKLLYSSKYLMVEEMLNHLHPPLASREKLQEGFSRVMEMMGVDEAMVISEERDNPRVLLGYGPLSTQHLDNPLPIRGTPWQSVMEGNSPYVHRGQEKAPFIMGMKEARFPSLIIVPLNKGAGLLGLASREPKDLPVEVLDLVNILGHLLEPSLANLQAPRETPSFSLFSRELKEVMERELGKGNSILLAACKVKNLSDLDKKMGIFETERLLQDLEREMATQLEGKACVFRGDVLVGYRVHGNAKFLEASGKVLKKHLPISSPANGTKAKLEIEWELVTPSKKRDAEEAIQHLLKRLNSSKGLFRG